MTAELTLDPTGNDGVDDICPKLTIPSNSIDLGYYSPLHEKSH